MNRKVTGHYVTISTMGEKCRAFVPNSLPPAPAVEVSPQLQQIIDNAMHALGGLDFAAGSLPDIPLFLYMYVRKEAVLSSQIEGTQSSLSDLLLFEADGTPDVSIDDVREIANYVAAIDHGIARLREGFPLSLRLLNEIHGILLSKGRGSDKTPGEFRRSQNWIGGDRPGNAAFVPPPPDVLIECMGALEKFLHDDPVKTPVLMKAALAHVQFETIHPYLDGNGRLGRLLITLILCAEGVLSEPLLYLSLHFKRNRQTYYDLLQIVRSTGNWEAWVEFFMTAVLETARQALTTIQTISALVNGHRRQIESLGKAASSALQVHHAMIRKPFITIQQAAEKTNLSFPSVNGAMKHLEDLGIAREISGKTRNRLYAYSEYIDLLKDGTEPIPQ